VKPERERRKGTLDGRWIDSYSSGPQNSVYVLHRNLPYHRLYPERSASEDLLKRSVNEQIDVTEPKRLQSCVFMHKPPRVIKSSIRSPSDVKTTAITTNSLSFLFLKLDTVQHSSEGQR